MANIPPPNSSGEMFDLTISICSFRRTQHLPQIIDRLWNQQTYQGKIQIIVWNNNVERKDTVEEICKKYVLSSTRSQFQEPTQLLQKASPFRLTTHIFVLMKQSSFLNHLMQMVDEIGCAGQKVWNWFNLQKIISALFVRLSPTSWNRKIWSSATMTSFRTRIFFNFSCPGMNCTQRHRA